MDRIYDSLVKEHLHEHRQIAMVTGPRQVGKTTSARAGSGDHRYYTWDRQTDRALITRGPDAVASDLALNELREEKLTVVFDELHKYRSWRAFLKGFFDVYSDRTSSVVTGSARLGHFRRGGDSLMGRYFLYRMHPVSVGELARTSIANTCIQPARRIDPETVEQLLRFGGYPEPFLNGTTRFYNKWRKLRSELLFREDLRDLTRIQEAGQVEVLGELLAAQAGNLVSYSSLAGTVNVAVDTIRRWIETLESLYYCFTVRPWSKSIPKALRKQPKVYLWDWSLVTDVGARTENFVAAHLLKAVNWWTDIGLGSFELAYLRDKEKREVDFVVVRDGHPWFLVEVKTADHRNLSPALSYFQHQTGARHAFQVALNAGHVDRDCFQITEPIIVPASTLLSQLV